MHPAKLISLSNVLLILPLLMFGRTLENPDNAPVKNKAVNPLQYVNPFIGTGGHGHTFPGATVPFGMVQLSPDTRLEGWDGCGGYHYSDEYIYGFSHTHLSGTGIPDYCDILLMPFTGEVHWTNGRNGTPGYRSRFSHDKEVASPGYYSVDLQDNQIKVQLTASERVGFHQYTYKDEVERKVLLDLQHRDMVINSWIKIINDKEIAGYRGSRSWADSQSVYFVMQFSESFHDLLMAIDDKQVEDLREILTEGKGRVDSKNLKLVFEFPKSKKPLFIKVGISANSIENARLNLESEINHWNFEKTKEQAQNKWLAELRKIEVAESEFSTTKDLTVFYTALYHTMVSPNIFNDINGAYLGRDFKEHTTAHNYYTVFSLWDTYRALHPLMTIIDKERTNDFIRTFIKQYEDGGLLPVWELSSNETWCMIGYHAIPVIADAYMKGIRDYDTQKALEAMLSSADQDFFGLKYYKKHGYIPADKEHESVSKTLEYSYDDWCIAVMAKEMGHDEISDKFMTRAQGYRHLFDTESGFMRARYNGSWFKPFDPREVNNNYTEANSWQYSFYVPHDMDNFASLMGGNKQLEHKLDQLFTAPTATTGREQSDITGLIGQYAHGNEPSHHITYLYNYTGNPQKTQEKVDFIMNNFYTDKPDGLIGNEDCGQMSAWAVFSCMGFYPVCPGDNKYVIGTPMFEEMIINLENGKQFRIVAHNRSKENKYIESAKLNGILYNKSFILHSDIENGGVLEFFMTNKQITSNLSENSVSTDSLWGTGVENQPSSAVTIPAIIPAPIIVNETHLFDDSTQITVNSIEGATIYYTLDGSDPTRQSYIYESPVKITESTVFSARAFLTDSNNSTISQSVFTKRPTGIHLQLNTEYAAQYSGNGPNTLVDGLTGGEDFRLGGWQGYQGVDINAQITIDNARPIKSIKMSFLQDINAWIFMPEKVELWSSKDGINYHHVKTLLNEVPDNQWGVIIHDFEFSVEGLNDKHIQLKAVNIGTCPDNHKGYPNPSWIFSDEIGITFK